MTDFEIEPARGTVKDGGYWYLASPYSNYEQGLDKANEHVCQVAASLIAEGLPIYCPIAHTHSIAMHGNLDPCMHDQWLSLDKCFEKHAAGIIVVQMPGWEKSFGVSQEIRWFRESGRPVLLLSWELPEIEDILDEAKRIVSGPRRRDYDHPLPNHQRIAALWQSYLDIRKPGDLRPDDIAMMMILLKIAREVYTPKRDNMVDVCGYASCIDAIRQAESLARLS